MCLIDIPFTRNAVALVLYLNGSIPMSAATKLIGLALCGASNCSTGAARQEKTLIGYSCMSFKKNRGSVSICHSGFCRKDVQMA